MQQVFPVEQHQHQPDQKRAGNINQKRGERKSTVVMLIDRKGGQITDQRSDGAAREDEKGSNQQSTDFSAEAGTLSA